MKIKNAAIDFLVGKDSTTITLYDRDASVAFAEIILTPKQLSSALSRLCHTDCSITVNGLEKIGKKHENDYFDFEIPELLGNRDEHLEQLNKLAITALQIAGKEDWIPDKYYSSQRSFFKRDDKHYARVTIRRWIHNL